MKSTSLISLLALALLCWASPGLAQTTTVTPSTTTLLPQGGDITFSVNTAFTLSSLNTKDVLILDARSPERFRGENETLDPVGGHIPGAQNRFYFDNLDDDGCFFKPAGTLHAEFTALLGARHPASVIHQCGSGVTACHNLLAMKLAGLDGSRLYPGSWSEWCADPARPVAKG